MNSFYSYLSIFLFLFIHSQVLVLLISLFLCSGLSLPGIKAFFAVNRKYSCSVFVLIKFRDPIIIKDLTSLFFALCFLLSQELHSLLYPWGPRRGFWFHPVGNWYLLGVFRILASLRQVRTTLSSSSGFQLSISLNDFAITLTHEIHWKSHERLKPVFWSTAPPVALLFRPFIYSIWGNICISIVKKYMHLKNNDKTSPINDVTEISRNHIRIAYNWTGVIAENSDKGFTSLGTKLMISGSKRTLKCCLAFCLGYITQSDSNYVLVLLSMFFSKMFKYKDI